MPDLPLIIRRHPRAKMMTLRLAPDGSEIRLTLPKRVPEQKGIEFIEKHQDWIEKQRKEHAARKRIRFRPGIVIPLFGRECALQHDPDHRGIVFKHGILSVGGERKFFTRRVEDWIKQEARRRYGELTVKLAAEIGQRPSSVTLRDTKSRWGSCSKRRSISLSWRLAFAPAAVARYVVAHEVAHLAKFDHSPAFWRVVEQLDPHWERHRDWLREQGKHLYDYGGN